MGKEHDIVPFVKISSGMSAVFGNDRIAHAAVAVASAGPEKKDARGIPIGGGSILNSLWLVGCAGSPGAPCSRRRA